MRALGEPGSAIIDLSGNLVVPGFNDAHWHFASLNDVELDGVASILELQKKLAAVAKDHPQQPWLTGRGWGYDVFPGQVPDKKYLDAIVSDRPVILWERDGHMALANSKALEIAGITRETKIPPTAESNMKQAGSRPGKLRRER